MIQNYSSIKIQSMNKQQHNAQIKHHLQLVFIYYCSFADRNNYHLLKYQNYRRFLIDSQIVKDTNDFAQFDILFKKISKGNSNALNFDQFLKLLPYLATSLYQGDTKQVAFKKLIKKDIKRLEGQIRENSEFGKNLFVVESFLCRPKMSNQETQIILRLQQSSIMKKLYSVYLSSTSIHQKSPADTFESFYKFLKDFQISPQLIYKSICFVTFTVLLMRKPEGSKNQFQLESFIKMIMLLSQIITKKQLSSDSNQLCPSGRICKILQRMQVSAGFQKISKQVKSQSFYTMSLVRMIIGQNGLLPDKDHWIQDTNEPAQRGSPGLSRRERCSTTNQFQKFMVASYESLNTLANQPTQYRQIKSFFHDMCAFGQVGNNKTLKSIKLKKLYTQTGLLKVVTQVWLDLTITELVRRSLTGKIQFPQFVQLLNQTARKLNVNQTQIYNLIINTSKDSSNHFNTLPSSTINYTQDEVSLCMQMLQTVVYPLQRVFHFYSKSKNQIPFSQMTKLMYDFEVFPSILTKTRLYQIFSECYDQSLDKMDQSNTLRAADVFLKGKSNYSKKQISGSKYSNGMISASKTGYPQLVQQKLMHISTFPQMMLKISNQICESGLSGRQKLIILVQKMHESKGQAKVVFGKGNLVSQLRKNYPQIYKMSFGIKQTKQQDKQGFDDLLDTISEY